MAVQINVAANQAALTASIQAGVQAYNQRFAQNNPINLSINQRAFSQPLGRMTGDVKDFEAALAASNARVIAFGASTAVLGGVIRSFKELANVTIDVEKNLADINRVFGLTTSQLQKFSTDLFSVGKQTASTFDDASKAALEFSRQGLKAEEVLVRTKDALTLTRLAGIGTANAVDALTSTVNGFAATGVTTTQILNKLVAVEQDYAVGAGDLAEALSRTGQAAQEAGVSLDQLNALVTAAQQSTARGGAVIGNALKTIFTRLQRTETLDQLEAFNIAVRDVQGNTLPAVTILQNFAGAYKNLADAQRAQLSEQVAGVYQVNILKAIVGDLNKSQGVYAGALQRGASATNEAEIATAKLNQTLDALLKQTATSTQQLANNIGKVTFEPLAKYGAEQLKSFVESMNEILEGEGVGSTFANGLLKGIRNVIAGPGAIAAFFTLFKLIQNSFTYLSQALPQIAGITTETQNRKNIEQSILQIMQQQGPASQALAGMMGNQAAQAQLLLQIARQQTAEYQMQSTLAKQLAAQLAGQGVRVKGSGGLQVTRAGGYIPAATRMAEVVGAQAGGYAPGRVVSSPVGGVMNTAEDVKYIPGFAQPFINPPVGSKAGRTHRQNSISRTGVDPYMASGFIPNFVKGIDSGARGKEFEKLINFYLIKEKTSAGSDLLDFNLPSNALTKASLNDKNKISLNPLSIYGDAKIKSTKETKKDLVKKLVGSLDSDVYGKLITRANKIKSDTINLNDFLLDKPSLISSKSSVTNDNLNASIESQLGPDVIENLQRLLKNNKNTNRLTEDSWYKKLKLNFIDDFVTIPDFSNSGFIPNFATPMSTASIPWFKKYSSKYKNAAGDTDLFKMGDFPTYGRGLDHEYAKKGNSAMLSYLHEDFVRSALNIALGSKKVIRPAEVGFKNKPVSDIANENDFDLLYRIADGSYDLLELKQDFKNVSGSVTGFMNKKLENAKKENPELVKKVRSMIAVSNRPKFTDPTGRNAGANFSEFEMAAASIVKDKYSNVDPSISAKLTKVTDGLLRRYEAKKNTTYGGFIPNFAYKQAVMGLEESMSGNKAIFDTKPFPHIRNNSQPTFSSAIADHGGLGNALSDSMRGQKAAGLMSKGFVPNFAPRPYRYSGRGSVVDPSSGISQYSASLGLGLADQERRAREEFNKIINALRTGAMNAQEATTAFNTLNTQAGLSARAQTSLTRILNREVATAGSGGTGSADGNSRLQRFSESLSKASTAIAIAGPMLAGFAEQAIYGNRKRTDMTSGERMGQSALSTGLSSVSTGAGIGASFGLPGAIIGGAIGGLVGLTSALNAATLSAEELGQLNQEQVQKSQASISAASSYIEAQKSLTQMISSGASSSDIEIATKKLSDNFNEIKDVKLQEIFNSTGGDVAAMTKQLQDYTNQVTKESARKTGLYAENLKPEERASALSLGLGKEQSKDFISKVREGLSTINQKTQRTLNYGAVGFQTLGPLGQTAEYIRELESKKLAESLVPQNEPERESSVKALAKNILDKNFEEVLKVLEKNIIVSEANKTIQNFNQRATKSFNQIFLEIEQRIAKSAFDVALSFEKDSGSRRIQSAILDFSTNFQDSINSFLSNNLPDIRKFDFTAATAGQKAQLQLQKSQQDYDKALAEQANDRSTFLNKNAENLTKEFKSSFLPSQASAEFFQKEVLPQIQAGTFSGSASSLANQFQTAAFNKADTAAKAVGITDLGESNIEKKLQIINNELNKLKTEGKDTGNDYEKLLTARRSIIELEKQTALFVNQNDEKKMQGLIESFNREKELFDVKQENAKKELEINKQLNEVKIAADKAMAVEKAKIDKENLMRMESMKDLSGKIGNTLEITKASMNAVVSRLQTELEDPRKTYGMGSAQISQRKFDIQDKILQKQRDLEDTTIKADIQQRMLQMAAEQENTNALYALGEVIQSYMSSLLEKDLGSDVLKQMQNNPYMGKSKEELDRMITSGEYMQKEITPGVNSLEQIRQAQSYTPEQLAKFEAYQRTQKSKEAYSANTNGQYNTNKFSANMAKAGFNKVDENGKLIMSQEDQINFLITEENKARSAGNTILEGTIRRYREEIDAKNESLRITREQLDEQIAIKNEIEGERNVFGKRLSAGFGKLSSQADDIVNNLAEELPMKFADNMSSALMEVAKGTKSIGDAFQDMAINFGQMIMQEVMRAAIAKTLGNIGIGSLFGQAGGNVSSRGIGYQHGGVIRANNGQYVSGMGSGDRYPAMLENGEYVLNREAVKKLGGKKSLDTFNFKHAPRFASGGNVSMEAEMALNKDQEMDYTKNLLYNRSNIGAINENDYTAYAYSESDYFKKMREKAIANEQKRVQESFARKQKNAQLISSLVGTAGSLFLAAGMSGLAKAGASGSAVSSGAAKAKPASLGSGMGSSNVSSFSAFGGSQRGGMIGFNSGGFVPYGSRLSDTIPALLTGGEYVMNNSAVRKYGLGAMNAMNAGAMSNSTNNNSTSTNNNTNNNATNISINIDRSGKATYGSDTNSYEKNDIAFSKQMAKRVADIAKGVISDESRYGGKIYQR